MGNQGLQVEEECQEPMVLLGQRVKLVTVVWQALQDQRGSMVLLEDQDLLDFRD